MAEPLRHQHGKAARDEVGGKRPVFRLRHLRTTQRVLRRGVRDHREPKRTCTRGAKQQGMRSKASIRRGHKPRLPTKRFALVFRWAERDLSAQRWRSQQSQQRQERDGVEEPHELPWANANSASQITRNESLAADFLRCHRRSLVPARSFAPTTGQQWLFEMAACPLSVQHGQNTDAESPQVNR